MQSFYNVFIITTNNFNHFEILKSHQPSNDLFEEIEFFFTP